MCIIYPLEPIQVTFRPFFVKKCVGEHVGVGGDRCEVRPGHGEEKGLHAGTVPRAQGQHELVCLRINNSRRELLLERELGGLVCVELVLQVHSLVEVRHSMLPSQGIPGVQWVQGLRQLEVPSLGRKSCC